MPRVRPQQKSRKTSSLPMPLPVRLPFDGRWFVVQGGDTVNVNHHMAFEPQWYGVDFAKLGGYMDRELSRSTPSRCADFLAGRPRSLHRWTVPWSLFKTNGPIMSLGFTIRRIRPAITLQSGMATYFTGSRTSNADRSRCVSPIRYGAPSHSGFVVTQATATFRISINTSAQRHDSLRDAGKTWYSARSTSS